MIAICHVILGGRPRFKNKLSAILALPPLLQSPSNERA